MNWFDISCIDQKTYVLSENKHWEKFNTYYLIGDRYNLVIDCGIGIYKIKNILDKIDNKGKKLVITHMHWDHIGNLGEFDQIYLSKKANYYLKNGVDESIESIRKKVIRKVDQSIIPEDFKIKQFKLHRTEDGDVVVEGDIFNLGNRKIEVIYTPGHTEDHISLYDHQNDYLFAGDFIYSGPLYMSDNYINLDEYYSSLKKIVNRFKDRNFTIFSSHYQPKISKEHLLGLYELINKLKKEGKYKKGAGIIRRGNYKIYL